MSQDNGLVYFKYRAFAAEPCISRNGNKWTPETLSKPETLAAYVGKPLMVDHSQNCRDVMGICAKAFYGEGTKRDGSKGVGMWNEGTGIATPDMWLRLNGDPVRGLPPLVRGVSVGGDGEGSIAPDGSRLIRNFDPQELSLTPFPSIATAEISELTRIMESFKPQTPKFIKKMQERADLLIAEGMKLLVVDPNTINFSETFEGDKLVRLYKRAEKFRYLRQEGVIIPPIVLFEKEGYLEIHDGHARVVAARRDGITPIDAILMSEGVEVDDNGTNPTSEKNATNLSVKETQSVNTNGEFDMDEKQINERFSILETKLNEVVTLLKPTQPTAATTKEGTVVVMSSSSGGSASSGMPSASEPSAAPLEVKDADGASSAGSASSEPSVVSAAPSASSASEPSASAPSSAASSEPSAASSANSQPSSSSSSASAPSSAASSEPSSSASTEPNDSAASSASSDGGVEDRAFNPSSSSSASASEKMTPQQEILEAHKWMYHSPKTVTEAAIPAPTSRDAVTFAPATVTNTPSMGGHQTGGTQSAPLSAPAPTASPAPPAAPRDLVPVKTAVGPSPNSVPTGSNTKPAGLRPTEQGIENLTRELIKKHKGNVKAAEKELMGLLQTP